MNIQEATAKYEAWLAKRITPVKADIQLKHTRMAEDPFPFLRATFYRWLQLWPEVCPDLAKAPQVLAVGDLHVENFGTWRDTEGRLIWGVNDVDEAYDMPYTIDLVRLATSAHIAIAAAHLAIKPQDGCEALLAGYRESLEAGGRPFVLAEKHRFLRQMALSELRDPVHFWEKMNDLPTVKESVPASAKAALKSLLPEPGLAFRLAHRIAGLGSLGRQRWVALAKWRGGQVAREAKSLLPSACVWASGKASGKILYEAIINRAVRVLDPFVCLHGSWILRRLAPDCSRIELATLPKERDEEKLLHAMGWETANVHLGTRKAIPAVLRDLKKRKSDWLHEAAKAMVKATLKDWEEWRER